MISRAKAYEHMGFIVEFTPDRCIHAAECIRGLPEVFDADKRPWIDPSQAEPAAIAEVIQRCPTGALQYRYASGSSLEEPDAEVTVEIIPSGPLYGRGDIRFPQPGGGQVEETRVALCRCGASQNKPWCDNSHLEMGFDDAGTIGESRLAPVESADTRGVDVTTAPNGPLLVEGRLTIVGADAQRIEGGRGALCRCGASNNKPFCDGSHVEIDFEAN